MGRRSGIVVVLVLAAAVGLAAWHRAGAAHESAAVAPEFAPVDPAVPEHRLLDGVLHIDEWREFGNPVGFSYLPAARPPGLTGVNPGNPANMSGGSHRGTGNGALIDAYHLRVGGHRLFVAVEFAAEPTSTCADTEGMNHAVCVRSGALPDPPPDDPDMKYMTVYFTADSNAALAAPESRKAGEFWADVEMVPAGEAAWFADLVARARAAVLE